MATAKRSTKRTTNGQNINFSTFGRVAWRAGEGQANAEIRDGYFTHPLSDNVCREH
jgi:hypothetical protein